MWSDVTVFGLELFHPFANSLISFPDKNNVRPSAFSSWDPTSSNGPKLRAICYTSILYHADQYHKIKTNAERKKYGNHNMNIIIYIQSDIIVNVHSYFYMSLRAHGGGIPKCCRFGGEGLHRGLAPCTAKVSNIASSELLQNNTRLNEIQNNSRNIYCQSLL